MHGYDLDFAVMGRPPADVTVDVRQLGRNPHVIVARKGHWLERDSGLSLTDLVHETFLTREPGSGTRTLMEGMSKLPRLSRGRNCGQIFFEKLAARAKRVDGCRNVAPRQRARS